MRYLEDVNNTTTFKAGDDSEVIRLSARNDNEPVVWSADDTAKVHVDKDGAHVLDFSAQLVQGSNIVTFGSSELSSLPAGEYSLEVWVDLFGESKQAIWPSSGMLKLTIDRNADSLEGGSITTITLDDFKKQLQDAIKSTDDYVKEHATKGDKGDQGPAGIPGQPGKSAYELSVENGFKGTETQWLESLAHGPKGEQGDRGPAGESAYELAVAGGYQGTEEQWLASLKGPKGDRGEAGPEGKPGKDGQTGPAGDPGKPGAAGKSAFELAESAGFKGSLQDWLNSLKGPKGDTGATGQPGATGETGQPGKDGKDGKTPVIKGGTVTSLPSGQNPQADLVDNGDGSYTLNLSIPAGPKGDVGGVTTTIDAKLSMGTVTTLGSGEKATASLVKSGQDSYVLNLGIPTGPAGQAGKSGADGNPGADGKSAYEVAVEKGFSGTEEQWLASLKGDRGADGKTPEISSATAVALKNGETPTAKIVKAADGAYSLAFGIPAGADGRPGKDGVYNGTTIYRSSGGSIATSYLNPSDVTGTYQFSSLSNLGSNTPKEGDLIVDTQNHAILTIDHIDADNKIINASGFYVNGKDGKDGNGSMIFRYTKKTDTDTSKVTSFSTSDLATISRPGKSTNPWFPAPSVQISPQAGDWILATTSDGVTYMYAIKSVDNSTATIDTTQTPIKISGKDGKDGVGTTGKDGKSAYQLAQGEGFKGTLDEWLKSLKGKDGKDGGATRGSMIFQSSETISTRGMTSTFDSSKITSPDGKLKPQIGDWIVAANDMGVSYAFQVVSVSGTTVNVNSNQTPIQVTGNSGASVESKAGHSTWVDTKWTNTEPIVNAWHTDFEGATLDDHPVEGDVVIGAGGGVARVDYVYNDDSNKVWIISTGKVLINLKG